MAAELQTPATTQCQQVPVAPLPAGERDLEASASGPSATRPWHSIRLAALVGLAASALLLAGTALVHHSGSAQHGHRFSSDAELVTFTLTKMQNDTKVIQEEKTKRTLEVGPTEKSELEPDIDALVEKATKKVDEISSNKTLEEGMEQLAVGIKTGDKQELVKALRVLRMSVNHLLGEVKSLETGLNMCGKIVCAGRNFTCCFGLCCGADAVCCPGAIKGMGTCCAPGGVCCPGSGLCGAPGAQCKGGLVLAPPPNTTKKATAVTA